jgi:hypothetical protein
MFSCFAHPNSFLAVPRASGLDFMLCTPGLIFGGTGGVGSRFHVLRARTRFWRYQGRQVLFSCFVLPDSFSTVPMASGPVFMFCAPGLIFGGTEGVGSHFHVCAPDLFSAVQRASGPVFMFCAPGLVFGGTESVGSRFHILRARTHFRRCRARRVPFSCFPPGLVFGATEGMRTRFHVLLSRTRFRGYRGRRVQFSCFPRTDSIPAVPRASGPVFIFCPPELVFDFIDGVGSRFKVLRSLTHLRRYRVR